MADRRIIYAAAFLRALATGMAAVLLGLHLARLDYRGEAIGLVTGVGLAGAAVAAVGTTLWGDRVGRRRLLVAMGLLGAAGGAALAMGSGLALILAAAFAGMLNGAGRDRGASLILDQAILPSTGRDDERTRILAGYNVIQDAGHALGALLGGLPDVFEKARLPAGPREVLLGYAALLLVSGALCLLLSRGVEAVGAARARVSPESRRILTKISALFAIDSIGGGFLAGTLVAYFLHERFGVDGRTLGPLFAAKGVLNALSHLGAAWLAKRIGLVNTMVFTHIPSSVLLVTVAIAPSFPVAAVLYLLREGLVEMDVPTRQSYVLAVVRPEERTFASGVTTIVRMGGWAVAPAFAGMFMDRLWLAAPLVIAAGMKIAYDVMLWGLFRRLKPPEERERVGA